MEIEEEDKMRNDELDENENGTTLFALSSATGLHNVASSLHVGLVVGRLVQHGMLVLGVFMMM